MQAPNLYRTLSKHGSGQSEDYLTEAFVLLLKNLLERVPSSAIELIKCLCGLQNVAALRNPDLVSIATQVVVDDGR